MFILRCRREINKDVALAREINALCARLTGIIDEREIFNDELDMLAEGTSDLCFDLHTLFSPAATVTSPIHATRALVPSRVDLLLPRKRFRDSISPEDSVEEDIDTNVLEDIKDDATADEVAVDRDVEARVDAGNDMEVDVKEDVKDEVEDEDESSERGTMEVGVDVVVGIYIPDAMLMPDVVERLEQVEEGLQVIYDHVVEIPLQKIENIETGQRELESRSLIASGES
ncbi:hypothetical protein Tco_0532048 [Tanacetum coccineum]